MVQLVSASFNTIPIDLFTVTVAILKLDLRNIMGCSGGMSTFRLVFTSAFRGLFSQSFLVMGKLIVVPC